jgi:Vesicle transport v-SNARE protein N-terminus
MQYGKTSCNLRCVSSTMSNGEDESDDGNAFEAYALEFSALLQEVRRSSISSNDDKSALLLFQQAQDLLQQMTVEARGIDSTSNDNHHDRKYYLDRIQVYKSQWKSTKLEYEQRILGLSSAKSNTGTSTVDSTESLQVQQQQRLNQAVQSIAATEETATNITTNLALQRDRLHEAQNKTDTVKTLTSSASSLADSLLKPWWRKGL